MISDYELSSKVKRKGKFITATNQIIFKFCFCVHPINTCLWCFVIRVLLLVCVFPSSWIACYWNKLEKFVVPWFLPVWCQKWDLKDPLVIPRSSKQPGIGTCWAHCVNFLLHLKVTGKCLSDFAFCILHLHPEPSAFCILSSISLFEKFYFWKDPEVELSDWQKLDQVQYSVH